MIAVALPIVTYTSHPRENTDMFSQPSANPYLLPKDPYQYETSPYIAPHQPPPTYAYSTGMTTHEMANNLPPPYRA